MNEITLSTGRLVMWKAVPSGKRTSIDTHFMRLAGGFGESIPVTNDERIEAAKAINAVLHPDGKHNEE